jgi:arginase
MRLSVIKVPYDSGLAGLRMGAGPDHLLSNGFVSMLQDLGHEVRLTSIHPPTVPTTEIVSAFELDELVAAGVRESARLNELPIILSGNCSNACIGAIAGSDTNSLGVLWLDGHLDFDTPETTHEGSLDAMALAIATGQCWPKMAGGVAGFAPLSAQNVVHVGARAGPDAVARLRDAEAAVVSAEAIRAARPDSANEAVAALEALGGRARELYVHLDLDVLDPDEVAPANEFVKPGGLSVDDVRQVVRLLTGRFKVVALGVTCYDPAHDRADRVLGAALELVGTVLAT